MSIGDKLQPTGRLCGWRRVPREAENDPGFREELLSLNKSGMAVIGLLGIMGAVLVTAVPMFYGHRIAWQYSSANVIVMWDKLLILLMSLVCFLWSRASFGLGTGRLIVALLLFAAALAAIFDDIARGDISFSPAYLTLIMLISGAIPYRAWQTFALCLTISAGYLAAVSYLHSAPDWAMAHIFPRQPIFLLLVTLVCTGISALLYTSRFRQYLARRRAEELKEQAAASEEKYRSLFDNATDAIFIFNNTTGLFEMVNPMMENLLGIPASELYTMPFHEIVDPDDISRIVGYHQARLRGEAAPMQYTFKVRSRLWSEPRICDMKLYTFDDDAGVTVGAVRDITERMLAEEKIRGIAAELKTKNRELRETQAQLVQSAQLASLGNLVAGVAHEVNNPLGAINSNADVATRAVEAIRSALAAAESSPADDDKLQRALTTLEELNRVTRSASERINVIITALRHFARLDEAELTAVDLHEGLESALTVLPQPVTKRIRIIKNFGALPEIRCHPNQINQVFMNLLVNAVEAIDSEGTITISTRREDDWAVIRVADTGRGIAPDIRDRIFDPGFTTKGVGVGTGLGLSICYRIIESHQGTADVVSEAGRGTEVIIRLPIT